MTVTPAWLKPSVWTRTTPWPGRERDSRTSMHLRFRVERVAGEHGRCEADVVPAEVRHRVAAHVLDREAVTIARVSVLTTSGRPNSVREA